MIGCARREPLRRGRTDDVEPRDQDFVAPPWESKLDTAAVLRRIPDTATVAGLFLASLVEDAKKHGGKLTSARERYVAFQFYPLKEHVQLLLECCAIFHPRRSLRTALRKLGHQTVPSLCSSTIGKVMFSSRDDVALVLDALVRIYPVNLRPSHAEIRTMAPGRAIVRLDQIHHFLDCHHVGIFEGALRYSGKRATNVRICSLSGTSAELLCTWET